MNLFNDQSKARDREEETQHNQVSCSPFSYQQGWRFLCLIEKAFLILKYGRSGTICCLGITNQNNWVYTLLHEHT